MSEQSNNSRDVVIRLRDVGLRYPMPKTSFAGHLLHMLGRFSEEDHWALRGVSFDIREGDVVGVVGTNGSGKSTLARLIAGIYEPDEGNVRTSTKARLLSIGVGFNNQLTGRENLHLTGSYFGMRRAKLKELESEIIEFSGVGKYIDQPVKTYSSGMRARLAFAIATATPPDVLIIDEALSTGDREFRKKAETRIRELIGTARAVFIVSHQMGVLRSLTNRAIWLEKGELKAHGEPDDVYSAYIDFTK